MLGNAAEHATVCVAAYRNKMELVVSVPIGNAMQVVLFTPFS